jgi:hypothetical protein
VTLAVYPGRSLLPGLTYQSSWSPQFFNLPTATAASGAEIDIAIAQYPLHDFELNYQFLRNGLSTQFRAGEGLEFKTMMGFLLQIGGTAGRFLFKNPDDYVVWQNVIGTGDGTTQTFTLTRFFGANGYGASEPVGQVNVAEAFNVYLNGSATPVNPTLYSVNTSSPVANTITFTTPPPNGQSIAVDMSYWYYCKLADNNNTLKKFMDQLWSMEKIALRSCRQGT